MRSLGPNNCADSSADATEECGHYWGRRLLGGSDAPKPTAGRCYGYSQHADDRSSYQANECTLSFAGPQAVNPHHGQLWKIDETGRLSHHPQRLV